MVVPNEKWRWFLPNTDGALMVEMDSGMRFETAYFAKQLMQNNIDAPFNIDHSQTFMDVVDELEACGVPFTAFQVSQIALNACAALHFHKPLVNKSFLYRRYQSCLDCHGHRLAWLASGDQTALVLTLEQEGESVSCLILSELFVSNDDKEHPQFSLIKVLSDRLVDLEGLDELEASNHQHAG